MVESPDKKDSEKTKKQSVSFEQTEDRKPNINESVESILADLLGIIPQIFTTIFCFIVRPKYTVYQLTNERHNHKVLFKPYTFLLIGCLLYSVFPSAVELRAGHSNTTEAIMYGFKNLLDEGPSLLTLIIQSLPILVITSIFAAIAGHIFNRAKKEVQHLFVYIYGVQGIFLLLFALSMELQSTALTALLGSDDYFVLIFLALVLIFTLQALRCFHGVLKKKIPMKKIFSALSNLAFVLLFLVPLPLSGYFVSAMQKSENQVKNENEKIYRFQIRIVDVSPPTIDDAHISFELQALERPYDDRSGSEKWFLSFEKLTGCSGQNPSSEKLQMLSTYLQNCIGKNIGALLQILKAVKFMIYIR